jgi:hypothetical protein
MSEQPMTPRAASIRLAQYGERTSTWATATHESGTERALHEIALTLNAEVAELRKQLEQARGIAVQLEQENAQLTAELDKYVGKEPTVAEEMQYLNRCLDAVYDLCEQAKRTAGQWENPLPVPEWVAAVEQAADGNRPDNPDDRRRRIYLDGKGEAWLDQSVTSDGTRWVAPIAGSMPSGAEPAEAVTERTGSLREIGRTW